MDLSMSPHSKWHTAKCTRDTPGQESEGWLKTPDTRPWRQHTTQKDRQDGAEDSSGQTIISRGNATTILTLWGAKVVCVQSFRPRWWRDTDGERHHSNIFETLKKETFHSNWHWTLVTQNTTPNDVIFFYSNNSAPSSSIFFCLPQQLGCDFLAFKPHVLKINLDANESEGN